MYFFFPSNFESKTCERCSIIKSNCPDGSSISCKSECNIQSKKCVNCVPDCTGHEIPVNTSANASQVILCPEINPSENFCINGKIIEIRDDIGCIVGYQCEII
jgi:hypothetical protein